MKEGIVEVATDCTRSSAMRPGWHRACILMASRDQGEAHAVGQEVLKVGSGWLRTYCRTSDLMEYPPNCAVAGVILATGDEPEEIEESLKWARRRWPHCPLTVVADSGGDEHELVARRNGASFLTRPVTAAQWSAIVAHATGMDRFTGRREQSRLDLATS